jgi:phosphatidylinositol alpha-1,6-mannosyltransferase
MKVLFITPGCFDKGGISRYNRFQIQSLRELYGPQKVKVLSLLGPDNNAFEDSIDVQWHGKALNLKNKILFIFQIFKIMIFWQPKFVLVGHVNLSAFPVIFSYLSKCKVILNVYGLEVWSKMSIDAAFGLKRIKYFISDCHNTKDFLVKEKKINRNKIEVIWDCVNTEIFTPKSHVDKEILDKYNIESNEVNFSILSLGRLSKPDAYYKGYMDLLHAFSVVSKTNSNTRLVFGGRGDYILELKEEAARLGIDNYVYFTGSIDESDLASIYQSCNLFSLITSSGEGMGEGIPLTPLEALACGKPILVGNSDGSREAIFNNENGTLIVDNNIQNIANAILKYIGNSEFSTKQSIAARQVALKYFSYNEFRDKIKLTLSKID